MIHFCIMSGHEGQLGSENKVYLTVMGGCELRRPTFARQITNKQRGRTHPMPPIARQTFVTLMGATEIKVPTLAEEFMELQELVNSGALTAADWEQCMSDAAGRSDVQVSSFTLMGGFDECALPSDSEEIDRLALQRHLGNISEEAGQILQHGMGQRGAERRAILQRALATVPC